MGTVGRLLLLMVMVTATCITPGKSPLSRCTLSIWSAVISAWTLSRDFYLLGILYCHVHLYCSTTNTLSIYLDYATYDGLIDRMMYFSVFILYILTPTIDVNIREISFITFKFATFFIIFYRKNLKQFACNTWWHEFNVRGLILIPIRCVVIEVINESCTP